ncbi:MAG: hypothetical protein A2Y57_04205 [Candidatus Woykebacteria bacterium RBG_13_40_7b]|uniref:Uncharacterized protein n=1 Tax=Candidatus Woykebacteria bacterium RBG_13_40_7b TaxID=1802594 RepID=A0A1G1W991_9BACT|nr:MAG: hypothetical protein A2Y57_04205 [Candidatus Woykebacteria bacterium RBG_13_40_7b]
MEQLNAGKNLARYIEMKRRRRHYFEALKWAIWGTFIIFVVLPILAVVAIVTLFLAAYLVAIYF